MKILSEAKQVGTIYHLTKDVGTLCKILSEQALLASRQPEYSNVHRGKYYYVSFSRDTSAKYRGNNRWNCGIAIDGTTLSNKYQIEPYSFAGTAIDKGKGFRVQYISEYDDGTYAMNLVNWGTINIPEEVYRNIEREIQNQTDDFNEKKKLTILGTATQSRNGRKRISGYRYGTPNGGIQLNRDILNDMPSILSKSDRMNEKEERIWLTENANEVNIAGCIDYILLPMNYNFAEELENNEPLALWLQESLQKIFGDNYRKHVYIL